MKKTLFSTLAVLLIAATSSFAQWQRGIGQQHPTNHPAAVLDMAKLRILSGAVTMIDIGFGMQYPTITVNRSVIKVAPVWFLLDKNFEIKTGDQVSVLAAPSTLPGDSYLYAVEIANTNSKTRIVLRDATGLPLWTGTNGGRAGNAAAPGCGIGCLDLATVSIISGTVEKVSMGIGMQMPSLVVKSATGTLVTMKLGPERILLAADFELKAGETVTAKFAHETCTDENVALQLTNAAGVTIVLREADGTPNWD